MFVNKTPVCAGYLAKARERALRDAAGHEASGRPFTEAELLEHTGFHVVELVHIVKIPLQ